MKTIVIYKSKTGFKKKYAEWISKTLGCKMISYREAGKIDLSLYQVVIYGGSLYATGIIGLNKILKRRDMENTKRLLVFAVGATPMTSTLEEELTQLNIPKDKKEKIKLFYMRGGFDFSKLNPIDKFLMLLLKYKIKSKSEDKRNPDEKGMLNAYNFTMDFTNEENISRLIEAYRIIETE